MNEKTAESIYFDNLQNIGSALINEDGPVNGAIAETNAFGWGADPSDSPTITSVSANSFEFESEIVLSGDSDEEKGWNGDELTVQLKGKFKKRDDEWRLDSYEVLSVASNVDR